MHSLLFHTQQSYVEAVFSSFGKGRHHAACLYSHWFDNTKYSGHSLRSGFATVAADHGADEKSIMNMTGHKSSTMVRRYIKETNLFKNNPLNKISL